MRNAILAALCLVCASATSVGADDIFYIEQCRVLDTRNIGAGNRLTNGVGYSFKVRGAVGGTQGGTAGCGIPESASGVMIVLTSVAATGAGYLEAYPAQNPPATVTSRLNYQAGLPIADEILIHMESFNPSDDDVGVIPQVSSTHLVGDIVAYTQKSMRVRMFLTWANAPFAPGAISTGDTFLIFNGIGAFAGHDDEYAIWDGTNYFFEAPQEGDLAYEASSGNYYRWRARGAAGWSQL